MADTDVHIVKTAADSAKTGVDVLTGLTKNVVGGGNDVLDTGIDLAQELKNLGIGAGEASVDKVGALVKRLIDRVAGLA